MTDYGRESLKKRLREAAWRHWLWWRHGCAGCFSDFPVHIHGVKMRIRFFAGTWWLMLWITEISEEKIRQAAPQNFSWTASGIRLLFCAWPSDAAVQHGKYWISIRFSGPLHGFTRSYAGCEEDPEGNHFYPLCSEIYGKQEQKTGFWINWVSEEGRICGELKKYILVRN